MLLSVLGSSSKGNCYLLGDKESGLIMIEAGIPFRKKVMPEIDHNIFQIKGVLVSHSHGDHSKYLPEVLSYSIPVYSSGDTMNELGLSKVLKFTPVEADKSFKIGSFKVIPIALKHDVSCYGYLIHHKKTGWVLFATDTYFIPKKYKGLSHIIIEANYDKSILDSNIQKGKLPRFLKGRIMASHMGIDTVQEMLSANDLSKTKNIVLIHLSDNNSDARDFKKRIQRQTGVPTFVARPGLKLELHG